MSVAPEPGKDTGSPRESPPPVRPASTAPVPSSGPSDAVSALADALAADDGATGAVNRPALRGLLLGIASLILNPVLLVGLAAIVVSAVGLQRAALMGDHGYSAVGRGKALGGIALGLLGTAVSILWKNALL